MLVRNAQGNIEDVTPTRQGAETALAAEARVLAQEIRRVRDGHADPDVRLLADAILKLGQLVYQGR